MLAAASLDTSRVTRFEFVKKRTLHRVGRVGVGGAGRVVHVALSDQNDSSRWNVRWNVREIPFPKLVRA